MKLDMFEKMKKDSGRFLWKLSVGGEFSDRFYSKSQEKQIHVLCGEKETLEVKDTEDIIAVRGIG